MGTGQPRQLRHAMRAPRRLCRYASMSLASRPATTASCRGGTLPPGGSRDWWRSVSSAAPGAPSSAAPPPAATQRPVPGPLAVEAAEQLLAQGPGTSLARRPKAKCLVPPSVVGRRARQLRGAVIIIFAVVLLLTSLLVAEGIVLLTLVQLTVSPTPLVAAAGIPARAQVAPRGRVVDTG